MQHVLVQMTCPKVALYKPLFLWWQIFGWDRPLSLVCSCSRLCLISSNRIHIGVGVVFVARKNGICMVSTEDASVCMCRGEIVRPLITMSSCVVRVRQCLGEIYLVICCIAISYITCAGHMWSYIDSVTFGLDAAEMGWRILSSQDGSTNPLGVSSLPVVSNLNLIPQQGGQCPISVDLQPAICRIVRNSGCECFWQRWYGLSPASDHCELVMESRACLLECKDWREGLQLFYHYFCRCKLFGTLLRVLYWSGGWRLGIRLLLWVSKINYPRSFVSVYFVYYVHVCRVYSIYLIEAHIFWDKIVIRWWLSGWHA